MDPWLLKYNIAKDAYVPLSSHAIIGLRLKPPPPPPLLPCPLSSQSLPLTHPNNKLSQQIEDIGIIEEVGNDLLPLRARVP
jgi:hypothetical protein